MSDPSTRTAIPETVRVDTLSGSEEGSALVPEAEEEVDAEEDVPPGAEDFSVVVSQAISIAARIKGMISR